MIKVLFICYGTILTQAQKPSKINTFERVKVQHTTVLPLLLKNWIREFAFCDSMRHLRLGL